jgi:hypothetical protein
MTRRAKKMSNPVFSKGMLSEGNLDLVDITIRGNLSFKVLEINRGSVIVKAEIVGSNKVALYTFGQFVLWVGSSLTLEGVDVEIKLPIS